MRCAVVFFACVLVFLSAMRVCCCVLCVSVSVSCLRVRLGIIHVLQKKSMMKLYDFIGVLVESVGVAIASPALLNPVSLVGVD